MNRETMEVNNYIDALRIINEKNNEYDILIDYHDKNKWITSRHITLTLIRPEDNPFIYEHMGNRRGRERYLGCYILNKDNSIAYIYDIRGRYDYCSRKRKYNEESQYNNGPSSVTLQWLSSSGIDHVRIFNRNKEVLLDNGKNKEDIYFPYIETFEKNKREMISIVPIQKYHHKLHPHKKGSRVCVYDFELKDRTDGGIDIYDTSGTLHYVCNIGKRYEYYLPNEFDKYLSGSNEEQDDILIEFIPRKKEKWIVLYTRINPQNNPYLIQKRTDGGVDLISKKDNTLKYICNIGRRFYYVPAEDRWKSL